MPEDPRVSPDDETLRAEIENAIDGAWTDRDEFDAAKAADAVLPIIARVRAADRAESTRLREALQEVRLRTVQRDLNETARAALGED